MVRLEKMASIFFMFAFFSNFTAAEVQFFVIFVEKKWNFIKKSQKNRISAAVKLEKRQKSKMCHLAILDRPLGTFLPIFRPIGTFS